MRDFERLVAAQDRWTGGARPLGFDESGEDPLGRRELYLQQLLQALPAAVYTTDAAGRITFYNHAAAELWGRRPELGQALWCGAWRRYCVDGGELAPEQSPMAIAVRENRPIRVQVSAERPDGSRVHYLSHATPLHDALGAVIGGVDMLVDISARRQSEDQLRRSEARYRSIFDGIGMAVWEEDFSAALDLLDQLRAAGVTDLRAHFAAHPGRLAEAIGLVRVNDLNDFAVSLFEARDKAELCGLLADTLLPETAPAFLEELVALWDGRRNLTGETVARTLTGRTIDVIVSVAFAGERAERTLVCIHDISARKAAERALEEQTQRLDALERVSRMISSNLDLERIVQTVTDVATALTGAQFGAFFYNAVDERGESYMLQTLSGAPREAFAQFPLPRATALFKPTFHGEMTVRADDIRTDPRYGSEAPHFGMPQGHLPVVSYLAVPVVSRSGEVHGGLFFGHGRPGVFTERSEAIVAGIAAHAAIAIDNARLLQAAQQEIARRGRAEERQTLLLSEIRHRVKNIVATVQAIAGQTLEVSDEQRGAFLARLRALGTAHELLADENWDRAALREVVERALRPFRPSASDRLTIAGPDVSLDAGLATTLALALHELATNAAKYGALSTPEGRVAIAWETLAAGDPGQPVRLRLLWQESDGPPVAPPRRRGFGTRLIERGLAGGGGSAHFDFAPAGVNCTMEIRL